MPSSKKKSKAQDLRSYVRLDLVLYGVIIVIAILCLSSLFDHAVDLGVLTALIGLATAVMTAIVTYLRGKSTNGGEET